MNAFLLLCVTIGMLVSGGSAPVSVMQADETECDRVATLIEGYNRQLCDLFAESLVQEGVVSDANDALRHAVQLRQDNARAAQVLLDLLTVRALTPDEAKLLTEFLAEGIVLDRKVRDAQAALDAAQAKLDNLKSRMGTMQRLLAEKRAWFDEHCAPSTGDPGPQPDPEFP